MCTRISEKIFFTAYGAKMMHHTELLILGSLGSICLFGHSSKATNVCPSFKAVNGQSNWKENKTAGVTNTPTLYEVSGCFSHVLWRNLDQWVSATWLTVPLVDLQCSQRLRYMIASSLTLHVICICCVLMLFHFR